MYRGTTPTFKFTLPIAAASITKLSITFRQPGGANIEKTLDDVIREDKTITATLTEEETLSLRAKIFPLEIQMRAAVDETRLVSQIWTVPVNRILKDGAL